MGLTPFPDFIMKLFACQFILVELDPGGVHGGVNFRGVEISLLKILLHGNSHLSTE